MENVTGAGDSRNIAAQDGARGTETFRPGAVRVFTYEGHDPSGLWRLSSGGAALLAAGSGDPVPGASYRVLAEARPDGGLSFRVLGRAAGPGSSRIAPVEASPVPPGAPSLSSSVLAATAPASGPLAGALAAALRGLAREGLSLKLAPALAKSAARSGDPEGAASFLARAAALGLGEGDGLDAAVEAVFGRGDASGGSGAEGGDAGGRGRGHAGSGRRTDREGVEIAGGAEAAAEAWLDAGTLDGPGLGRFLESLVLGAKSSQAREKGAWSFVPFAFELDGVEISGTLRLQLPEESGGPGCIAATLVAGRARTRWRFRVDFGDGPSPRLSIGRGRSDDGALRRAAARLAEAHGVASFRILAPGEDADGGELPAGADERA